MAGLAGTHAWVQNPLPLALPSVLIHDLTLQDLLYNGHSQRRVDGFTAEPSMLCVELGRCDAARSKLRMPLNVDDLSVNIPVFTLSSNDDVTHGYALCLPQYWSLHSCSLHQISDSFRQWWYHTCCWCILETERECVYLIWLGKQDLISIFWLEQQTHNPLQMEWLRQDHHVAEAVEDEIADSPMASIDPGLGALLGSRFA